MVEEERDQNRQLVDELSQSLADLEAKRREDNAARLQVLDERDDVESELRRARNAKADFDAARKDLEREADRLRRSLKEKEEVSAMIYVGIPASAHPRFLDSSTLAYSKTSSTRENASRSATVTSRPWKQACVTSSTTVARSATSTRATGTAWSWKSRVSSASWSGVMRMPPKQMTSCDPWRRSLPRRRRPSQAWCVRHELKILRA